MKMNVVVDDGCYMPVKAHEWDAGFDLRTPKEFMLYSDGDYEIINTGVHVEIPEGYCGFIKSKSGLNVKHDIICEGVVDCGFTGTIVVKLRNIGLRDYKFDKGDKFCQLVILPTPKLELELVKELKETERGASGFGSTGR